MEKTLEFLYDELLGLVRKSGDANVPLPYLREVFNSIESLHQSEWQARQQDISILEKEYQGISNQLAEIKSLCNLYDDLGEERISQRIQNAKKKIQASLDVDEFSKRRDTLLAVKALIVENRQYIIEARQNLALKMQELEKLNQENNRLKLREKELETLQQDGQTLGQILSLRESTLTLIKQVVDFETKLGDKCK